jgi:hypothetical protein
VETGVPRETPQKKNVCFLIQESPEFEDSLTDGAATKFVPVCMDEFNPAGMLTKEPEPGHNDSGEFPDLLDSESNLSMDYTKFGNVNKYQVAPHPQSSPAVLQEDETGLTFATLSGVKPEYSSTDLANVLPVKEEPVVVARKSSVPVQVKQRPVEAVGLGVTEIEAGKTEALVTALTTEAVAQLAKAQIKLPAGTCLVPAEAKCEADSLPAELLAQQILSGAVLDPSIVAGVVSQQQQTQQQQQQQPPMTITIQYKIYPDSKTGEPQTVSVKRELADLLSEATDVADKSGIQRSVSSPALDSGTPIPPPTINTPTSSSCDGMEPMASTLSTVDPTENSVDPVKETRTVFSASGVKFEIPALVTGGFDLDTMVSFSI